MHLMQQWPDGKHITEMTAFVAVAEQLSFTKGADKLGRDATVLSRHVQALERRLGVRLLERTTRRVALTEAGARLLARAQSILAEFADAEAEASAHASEAPRGVLRLALPASFGRMWIAPSLPDFMAAHPQVRIEAEFSNRFVDLIGEGFDAAVRLGALPDSSLIARKIANRRRLICASPNYFERHGAPKQPEDLTRHACLSFRAAATYPDWHFMNAAGQRRSVRVEGPLVSDDAEALVDAAVAGSGVLLSADWLVGRELAQGRLVPVLDQWTAEDEGAIYTVFPSKNFLPAKTRAFVDWMAERFAPVPPWLRVDTEAKRSQ